MNELREGGWRAEAVPGGRKWSWCYSSGLPAFTCVLCPRVLLLEGPSVGQTDVAKKKMVKNGILQLSGLQNVRTLSHGELMLCAFCLFDLYAIGQLRNTILDYVSPCFPVFFRGDRMCLKAGFQTSCLSISPLLLAIYSS